MMLDAVLLYLALVGVFAAVVVAYRASLLRGAAAEAAILRALEGGPADERDLARCVWTQTGGILVLSPERLTRALRGLERKDLIEAVEGAQRLMTGFLEPHRLYRLRAPGEALCALARETNPEVT